MEIFGFYIDWVTWVREERSVEREEMERVKSSDLP